MDELAKKLIGILSQHPQIKLAILFGSQATGHARPTSDIDLAVLADQPIDTHLKLELIERVGFELGRAADIVDLHSAQEPLLGQVFKGKKLLGDTAAYARLLTKHLLNTADFLPLRERILKERQAAWMQ